MPAEIPVGLQGTQGEVTPPPAVPLSEPVARAARLVQEVFKRRAQKLEPKPRTNKTSVYASNIPECERQGVYEFTHGTEAIPHDWQLEALFQAGNVNEAAYKQQLTDLGFELVEASSPLLPEMRAKFNIGGYIDWRIKWESHRLIFEAKMMSPLIYDKIDGISGDILKAGAITHEMVEAGVRSMNRFPWTRKYVRQISVYMVGLNEEVGIFALTNGRGSWKFVIVPLDYELAERALKTVESINKHVKAGTLPERIPYDSENCGRCKFANVCIPDIKQDARLKIVDNEKIAAILEIRDHNLDGWKRVEQANKVIKEFFDDVKDGVFALGNFIVTRKAEARMGYAIPDDVKAKYQKPGTIYKNKFERISKPDAETVYIEPKRSFGFGDEE